MISFSPAGRVAVPFLALDDSLVVVSLMVFSSGKAMAMFLVREASFKGWVLTRS